MTFQQSGSAFDEGLAEGMSVTEGVPLAMAVSVEGLVEGMPNGAADGAGGPFVGRAEGATVGAGGNGT